MQRKFLLLVPPGGDVACALVEASQYAYLYRSVAPRQEYGEHQVGGIARCLALPWRGPECGCPAVNPGEPITAFLRQCPTYPPPAAAS